jgi:adenylate kinase
MKIKNVLILIGPPGSGKGTQGKLLAPILKYNYLSMGSTLREKAKSDEEIKKTIDAGHIIPDTMIRKIFFDSIKALPKAAGVILDGFPRDIDQTNILDELISKHKVDKVRAIFIDVPKSAVLERLKKREGTEGRKDDDPEIIHTRFQEYDRKTHPLIEYFQKHHYLIHINGDQAIEKVHADILKRLTHGTIGI